MLKIYKRNFNNIVITSIISKFIEKKYKSFKQNFNEIVMTSINCNFFGKMLEFLTR